jgi:hypothetical protein
MAVTIREMSTNEILERLEELSQKRLSMSAKQFIQTYKQGKLQCPGIYADMLALVRLLPRDHEILGG